MRYAQILIAVVVAVVVSMPAAGRPHDQMLLYAPSIGPVHESKDICPDMTVSCVYKGTQDVVGKLGKKPFCWRRNRNFWAMTGSVEGSPVEIGCAQCEPEKNSHECNVRFADQCLGNCEAVGPLGGH